jgi:hypothetical protein
MEREMSLLWSQEPFTDPYPESGYRSPVPSHSISITCILILSRVSLTKDAGLDQRIDLLDIHWS